MNVAWLKLKEETHPSENATVPRAYANTSVLPTLLYTALNLRPTVSPKLSEAKIPPSPAFVAIGYANVMLPGHSQPSQSPSELPSPSCCEFWARARSAGQQFSAVAKSPFLLSRNLILGRERGLRAVKFALEDDGIVQRPPAHFPNPPVTSVSPSPVVAPAKPSPLPSVALVGLSLLGSVDAVFKYDAFPSIDLTHMRCSTRKAYGGMLMFCYTFRGCLYLCLGWDECAFDESAGLGPRSFLEGMRDAVAEYLVGEDELGEGDDCARGVDVSRDGRLQQWKDRAAGYFDRHARL